MLVFAVSQPSIGDSVGRHLEACPAKGRHFNRVFRVVLRHRFHPFLERFKSLRITVKCALPVSLAAFPAIAFHIAGV